MKVVELKDYTPREIVRRIKELSAADSQNVAISPHAKERMLERGITRVQVQRCLEKGQQDGVVEKDEHGHWRARMKLRTAGILLTVVASLVKQQNGEIVVVITTFK